MPSSQLERRLGAAAVFAYVATIFAANSVGFGLTAPAGVFAAGLALLLRLLRRPARRRGLPRDRPRA